MEVVAAAGFAWSPIATHGVAADELNRRSARGAGWGTGPSRRLPLLAGLGNLRMTEWQGAVLRAQLARFPEQNAIRNANATALDAALDDIPGLRAPRRDQRMDSQGNHCFVPLRRCRVRRLATASLRGGLGRRGNPMGVVPLVERPRGLPNPELRPPPSRPRAVARRRVAAPPERRTRRRDDGVAAAPAATRRTRRRPRRRTSRVAHPAPRRGHRRWLSTFGLVRSHRRSGSAQVVTADVIISGRWRSASSGEG